MLPDLDSQSEDPNPYTHAHQPGQHKLVFSAQSFSFSLQHCGPSLFGSTHGGVHSLRQVLLTLTQPLDGLLAPRHH